MPALEGQALVRTWRPWSQRSLTSLWERQVVNKSIFFLTLNNNNWTVLKLDCPITRPCPQHVWTESEQHRTYISVSRCRQTSISGTLTIWHHLTQVSVSAVIRPNLNISSACWKPVICTHFFCLYGGCDLTNAAEQGSSQGLSALTAWLQK